MSVDGHRALIAILRKHMAQEHVVIRAVMALNNLTGGCTYYAHSRRGEVEGVARRVQEKLQVNSGDCRR